MNIRNTKQKEIILEVITEKKTHPTIQEIYDYAKEKNANIGQATIYRNINKLVTENKVIRLPAIEDEGYHYDINTTPHNHLICSSCGRIIDLFDDDYNKMIQQIEKNNSIRINKALLILDGICSKCITDIK